MLNVFILEDSVIQLRTIENTVQRVSNELQIKTNIKTFTTIADLQKAVVVSPTGAQNVYILDLEINGINNAGLEISQKIRQRDKLAALIFITVHEELLYQTYKYRVSALDFIAKDRGHIYGDLLKDFESIQRRLHANHPRPFVYKDYSNTVHIDFLNVNFFESNYNNSHSSILNTVDNQQIQINYNLHAIEKLDQRLFRAHRSFLVNPQQVRHVDIASKTVYFYNGATCPVSQLHLRSLLKLITTRK